MIVNIYSNKSPFPCDIPDEQELFPCVSPKSLISVLSKHRRVVDTTNAEDCEYIKLSTKMNTEIPYYGKHYTYPMAMFFPSEKHKSVTIVITPPPKVCRWIEVGGEMFTKDMNGENEVALDSICVLMAFEFDGSETSFAAEIKTVERKGRRTE